MKPETPNDPYALALTALAAALSDERRALRFLDLTGIEIDELRRRAAEPELLVGLIRFLEAHEPDLLAVCDFIGANPEQLVAARRKIESDEIGLDGDEP